MSQAKVWLGGEGPNEIGDKDTPGGSRVGVIEALLRRVEPHGWRVDGGTLWKRIRKFQVRAAIGRENHGDIHNVAGLVNQAFEQGCDLVAFTRDIDAEPERAHAIAQGISHARNLFPLILIVGGPAIPTIEGWILALCSVRDTESMSRSRANETLEDRGVGLKQTAAYVQVIDAANLERLPPGCDALRTWLATARSSLGAAVRGVGNHA